MDKNIAAFMRNDVTSVTVCFIKDPFNENQRNETTLLGKDFPLTTKGYIYLTNIPLQKDDVVVVFANDIVKYAIVMEVHEELHIQPNSDIAYKWIATKVDMESYREEMAKNKEITTIVSGAYKKNVRNQFRAMLLGDIGDDALKTRLLGLVGE